MRLNVSSSIASLATGQRELFHRVADLEKSTVRVPVRRGRSKIISIWFQCAACGRRSNPSSERISIDGHEMHARCYHCGEIIVAQVCG